LAGGSVVALFSGADDAVGAIWEEAVIVASGDTRRLALFNACLYKAVVAGGEDAGDEAVVVVGFVAIVAGFTGIDEAIAAEGWLR
jgi:hypothetical protein